MQKNNDSVGWQKMYFYYTFIYLFIYLFDWKDKKSTLKLSLCQ